MLELTKITYFVRIEELRSPGRSVYLLLNLLLPFKFLNHAKLASSKTEGNFSSFQDYGISPPHQAPIEAQSSMEEQNVLRPNKIHIISPILTSM